MNSSILISVIGVVIQISLSAVIAKVVTKQGDETGG